MGSENAGYKEIELPNYKETLVVQSLGDVLGCFNRSLVPAFVDFWSQQVEKI